MGGPLEGLKVIEMAGLGPVPFCAMLLADMGAKVVRIERPGRKISRFDVTCRSRETLQLDLRAPGSKDLVVELACTADLMLEGFRPGVMERLGLGPESLESVNPKLIYGQMTGWGQTGPLAARAGHDINYIAISGALHAIGAAGEAPVPPLNYVGDYGGGAMLLLSGVLAALHEARQSGRGQVVDAAMSDGAALLSATMYGMKSADQWSNSRGDNLLDGGAHFYSSYICADGKYVAVGAIEPEFYRQLCETCGYVEFVPEEQHDAARWPALKARLARIFLERSRDEWCSLFEGSDACVAPILDWDEAPRHPHNLARRTFTSLDGVLQPSPAPRFSRTPCREIVAHVVADPNDVLRRWNSSAQRPPHSIPPDC